MSSMSREETPLVRELRGHIREMEHQLADLKRQNAELREAVVALMEPGMPRILLARTGIMVMDKEWQKGRS